jgi:hypothetical protein
MIGDPSAVSPLPLLMSCAGARGNTVIGYVQSGAPVVPRLSIPGIVRLAA